MNGLPFLRVVCLILRKHSIHLSSEILHSLLETLCKLLDLKNTSTNFDVWVLESITNLVKNIDKDYIKRLKNETEQTWLIIWKTLVKKLTSNSPQLFTQKTMDLLQRIFSLELISYQVILANLKEVWNMSVFSDKHISTETLKFVTQILRILEISDDTQASENGIREELLLWILGSLEYQTSSNSKSKSIINFTFHSQLVAFVISSLISSVRIEDNVLETIPCIISKEGIVHGIQIQAEDINFECTIEENLKQLEESRTIIPTIRANQREEKEYPYIMYLPGIKNISRSHFLTQSVLGHLQLTMLNKISTINQEIFNTYEEIKQKTRKTLGIDTSKLSNLLNCSIHFTQVLIHMKYIWNEMNNINESYIKKFEKYIQKQFNFTAEILGKLYDTAPKLNSVLPGIRYWFILL